MKHISQISILWIIFFSASIYAQKTSWQQAPLNFITEEAGIWSYDGLKTKM